MNRFSTPVSTILAFGPVGIVWAFIPIHLYSLKASYTLISLLWGGLLDKSGNGRAIILLSLLAETIGFSTFPFLSSPAEFVVVVSLMSVFTSSFLPVFSARATWTSSFYGRAIGGFWTAASIGYGVSTLIGGVVYQFYGSTYLFTLGALFGLAGCFT